MISAAAVPNLIAWTAQIAVVVMAAAGLSALIRIDAAGVRYAYWRAVATLCLVLPWIATPRPPASGAVSASAGAVTAMVTAITPGMAAGGAHIDAASAIAVVIALGAGVRLAWLGAGFLALRRLRGEASMSSDHAIDSDLQETLGTRADVRYVAALPQPVTFGIVRPVILLPVPLREQSPGIRRAVLGHELLHVQRQDWAWLIAEEIARAALWFNPAAWWLISRIQLAREEAVDELAVMLTGERKIYIEALLAFGDSTSPVSSAAFARRRHLFRRITLVSKEVSMSSRRIVASCAVMALVLLAGSWYAASAFPLRQSSPAASASPGPLERQAHPITPENPVPRRVTSEPIGYPAEAAAVDARGDITLVITLDELGRVAEARPVRFGIVAPGLDLTGDVAVSDNLREKFKEMVTRRGGRTGPMLDVFDAVTRAASDSVHQWRYDPPYQAPISFPVSLTFGGRDVSGSTSGRSGSDVRNEEALRVGGTVKTPLKTRDVRPAYPQSAMDAGVEGVVIVEVRIERDGRVGDARVLRSIPLLDEAALAAVRQWTFVPTLLNGEPVPIMMTATIAFTLSK